jgi:succinate dehydrogenase hydrophobic anchor subunit
MKKRTGAILFAMLIVLGISGFLKYIPYQYIELHSWNNVRTDYPVALVIGTLMVAFVLLLLYRNMSPVKYADRMSKPLLKIFVFIFLLVFGFFTVIGLMYLSDSFFEGKKDMVISGMVSNMQMQRSGSVNSSSRSYMFDVYDKERAQEYRIQVKKKTFESLRNGSAFTKLFHVSRLGVIYLKEE